MDFLPLFAKLSDQPCLIVGGGTVAHRKTLQLLKAGALVTVNAPEFNPALESLANEGKIKTIRRAFDASLVTDALLVIAATSDVAVNQQVAASCAQEKRFCNVVDDGDRSTAIMPAVIDRSPLVIAVSTGGESPVLARIIRQRIEEWLPTRISDLVLWAGRWRDAVKSKFDTIEARMHFWQRMLDGPAAEQVLAAKPAIADRTMQAALDQPDSISTAGEAWLVGAGPGDPELITRRGLQLLQKADVVMHDRLIGRELLDLARRDAELIDVGKTAGQPSPTQADINAQLTALVRAGKRVCRLKGGDPFIFGRGGEELAALAAEGLAWQVVPGISAANGCAAYAGIPLTHRGMARSVTFVTASQAGDDMATRIDWRALAGDDMTLVIYMGARQIENICAALINAGRNENTPIAVIERGTTTAQRIVGGNLANIGARCEAAGVSTPAVLIVGAVAELTEQFAWFGDEKNAAPDAVANL